MQVTEHVCRTARHTSFYLQAGDPSAEKETKNNGK